NKIVVLEGPDFLPDHPRNWHVEELADILSQALWLYSQPGLQGFECGAQVLDDHIYKNGLTSGKWLLDKIRRPVQNPRQIPATEKGPNLAVARGQGQKILDAAGFRFGTKRDSSEDEAADDTKGAKEIEPVIC